MWGFIGAAPGVAEWATGDGVGGKGLAAGGAGALPPKSEAPEPGGTGGAAGGIPPPKAGAAGPGIAGVGIAGVGIAGVGIAGVEDGTGWAPGIAIKSSEECPLSSPSIIPTMVFLKPPVSLAASSAAPGAATR